MDHYLSDDEANAEPSDPTFALSGNADDDVKTLLALLDKRNNTIASLKRQCRTCIVFVASFLPDQNVFAIVNRGAALFVRFQTSR